MPQFGLVPTGPALAYPEAVRSVEDSGCGDYRKFCLIPSCNRLPQRKLHVNGISICTKHAVQVWKTIADLNGEPMPPVVDAPEKQPPRRKLPELGDVYFAKVDDLIKIGWSSQLHRRIQQYGPSAVILCHFPGTQADEKNLHLRFKPYLSKGREWFEDHPRIRAYVEEMIAAHGRPYMGHTWTEPSVKPMKPRYWRGAA